MTKGIVLFFEQGFPMWVQHVTYEGNTIRGWVRDGHFWFDYNNETQDMRICVPQSGTVQWDKPINILHKVVIKCTITVPNNIDTTEYSEVIKWATEERKQYESIS